MIANNDFESVVHFDDHHPSAERPSRHVRYIVGKIMRWLLYFVFFFIFMHAHRSRPPSSRQPPAGEREKKTSACRSTTTDGWPFKFSSREACRARGGGRRRTDRCCFRSITHSSLLIHLSLFTCCCSLVWYSNEKEVNWFLPSPLQTLLSNSQVWIRTGTTTPVPAPRVRTRNGQKTKLADK